MATQAVDVCLSIFLKIKNYLVLQHFPDANHMEDLELCHGIEPFSLTRKNDMFKAKDMNFPF